MPIASTASADLQWIDYLISVIFLCLAAACVYTIFWGFIRAPKDKDIAVFRGELFQYFIRAGTTGYVCPIGKRSFKEITRQGQTADVVATNVYTQDGRPYDFIFKVTFSLDLPPLLGKNDIFLLQAMDTSAAQWTGMVASATQRLIRVQMSKITVDVLKKIAFQNIFAEALGKILSAQMANLGVVINPQKGVELQDVFASLQVKRLEDESAAIAQQAKDNARLIRKLKDEIGGAAKPYDILLAAMAVTVLRTGELPYGMLPDAGAAVMTQPPIWANNQINLGQYRSRNGSNGSANGSGNYKPAINQESIPNQTW